ncbi:MAG: hydroxyacid dehydrogenase [Crenarchaeota archaeon]|nr:hydroxyacid dehydrogenase [Thermoproteota archaeon]MDW8034676.1 hydroxyacid dehydrogenase [Nitrososphaerota archaeon]
MRSAVLSNMRILIADQIHEEGIRILQSAGFKVDNMAGISREELLKIIGDYHVLIVRSRTLVDKEVLTKGKNLILISRAGSGLDNIDVKEAERLGIKVINCPNYVAKSTAELTIGLILCLLRKIVFCDACMKCGVWSKSTHEGEMLWGKKVAVIGWGRVGKKVSRLLKAFGCEVVVVDPFVNPHEVTSKGFLYASLEEALKTCDIFTVHVSLNDNTRGMFGKREFSLMKPGSYFVNTSRGEVVDEEALIEALKTGKLKGVALDVYSSEPPRLPKIPEGLNVVFTPHIGAQTIEAQRETAKMLSRRIIRMLSQLNGIKSVGK